MKRKIWLLIAAMLAALLLNGCAMRTVDEMYSLPKRSEEYSHLQSAIDIAMAGLDYSAPVSGENQQTVQIVDLNGDGNEEYLVFAKGTSEKPLQILIFYQDEEGKAQITEIIASNGTAFEHVEYAQIDGKPGFELIVGRQVSNQLMRNVSVYSFATGRAEQLLTAAYSRLLTCDMGGSDQSELLLIQRGESDVDNAVAVLYRYRSKSMVRSLETKLSQPAGNIKRIMAGKLQCGTPAIYVASSVDETAILTDILALKQDRFVNISFNPDPENVVQTLRNYYVYADDVDEDGVLELPSLHAVRPVSANWMLEEEYVIRWYSVDLQGRETDKLYTFHNYGGGWFLRLDSAWAERITVYQVGNTYAFSMWDEEFTEAEPVFTLYALTGSDRENQAKEDSRFALHTDEGVIYAAKLEAGAEAFGIDETYLVNSFQMIHQDWKTGET